MEAHDERELEAALASGARLIGLNNRNLSTLEVDPDNCLRLTTKSTRKVISAALSSTTIKKIGTRFFGFIVGTFPRR